MEVGHVIPSMNIIDWHRTPQQRCGLLVPSVGVEPTLYGFESVLRADSEVTRYVAGCSEMPFEVRRWHWQLDDWCCWVMTEIARFLHLLRYHCGTNCTVHLLYGTPADVVSTHAPRARGSAPHERQERRHHDHHRPPLPD